MPRRKPVIDADDPTGQGMTTLDLPAWVDAPLEIPDEPFPTLPQIARHELADPRQLLADAKQALKEVRAERDEARALANAFRRDLQAERERSVTRLVHAVVNALGADRPPPPITVDGLATALVKAFGHPPTAAPLVTQIADAVVRRLIERGQYSAPSVFHPPPPREQDAIVRDVTIVVRTAFQTTIKTTGDWGRYLDSKIIALAYELREVAASVDRLMEQAGYERSPVVEPRDPSLSEGADAADHSS